MKIQGGEVKIVGIALLLILSASGVARAQSNQAYEFVSEYVRELSAYETVREAAEKEGRDSGDNFDKKMATCVRNAERVRLELNSQIVALARFKLVEPPFEKLVPMITSLYARRIELWGQFGEACATFMAGPKPGVDFGKLAAELPKLTAQLEFADKTLFEATPIVFGSLIDMRPDSQNHANHLTITKTERNKLVASLETSFGKKFQAGGEKNYTVSSAEVLRDYLAKKGFKCSDEPWQ